MKCFILSEICRENTQRAFIVKYYSCIQFNIYGKYDAVRFSNIFLYSDIEICSEYKVEYCVSAVNREAFKCKFCNVFFDIPFIFAFQLSFSELG